MSKKTPIKAPDAYVAEDLTHGAAGRLSLVLAAALILLHVACELLALRYQRIGTDVLAHTEATVVYAALTVLSPLTSYLRLGVMTWTCFTAGRRASAPVCAVAAGSLAVSAALQIFNATRSDRYFAENLKYHLLTAGLSLLIGVCALLFLRIRAAERRRKCDERAVDMHDIRRLRKPLARVFLIAALTMLAIDLIYQSYIVLDMATSVSGLTFEDSSDVLALVWDYTVPVIKSALGFGFMCLCGAVLTKKLLKSE